MSSIFSKTQMDGETMSSKQVESAEKNGCGDVENEEDLAFLVAVKKQCRERLRSENRSSGESGQEGGDSKYERSSWAYTYV